MTAFNIKDFFISILLFFSGCVSFNTPEPVKVEKPVSVNSTALIDGPAFQIEIKKDRTTWCTITLNNESTEAKKISAPVKENLSKEIAAFKKDYSGKRTIFLLKANTRTKYKQFEEVIEALAQNQEFKYHLISADE